MAGGVGTDRPFAFNVKCIAFTAVVVATWRYLPRDAWWAWLAVLWWPYVAMAWYDELYDCRDKMRPTALPLGEWRSCRSNPRGTSATTTSCRRTAKT